MFRASFRTLGRFHTLSRTFGSFRNRIPINYSESRVALACMPKLLNGTEINQRGIHSSELRQRPTTESLDASLHRLDVEIRKTGRINRREIEELLEDIRGLDSITSNQSLMIIRCCGELVPEETHENRTKLVQEVWKTMEKLKVPMDISHYNALLRVYLENEHKFNPTEFLEQITSKGIEPNRVTYQRLIARFCQDGDIEGASTILQHMKEKQLPINIHVFNALILGHAHANDMESAEGIISVMKQAGLEPNDDTYTMLMRGYALKGDLDNIKRIIQDCEQKEIYLLDRDFLEVIYTLAASKHEHLVKEIIPFLKKHAGFNQEATNIIYRLVNIGQEDIAYELLKGMPRPMRAEELAPSGNFFIRQMVLSSTPSEKILKLCHEMMNSGLNKMALLRACEYAVTCRQFDKAYDFLEVLKESGFPIRQHYFWPIFASSKSEKDVYDGLKYMLSLEMTPTVETLREYIIPALVKNSSNRFTFEGIIEKLSNYSGINTGVLAPAALAYLVVKGELDMAAKFVSRHRVNFNNQIIRRILVDAYVRSENANSIAKILASTAVDGDESTREAVGLILKELLDYTRTGQRAKLLLPLLKECLANGLGISNSALEWIQNKLEEELTPEITSLLSKLTSGDLLPKPIYFTQITKPPPRGYSMEQTIEELEQNLENSDPTMPRWNRGLKKTLLLRYCRAGHADKAEKLYNELKQENFLFTPGINALMMDAYCQANDFEKAIGMYSEFKNKDFSTLDDLKILRYALILVSNDKFDECLDVLKNQGRDETKTFRGGLQVNLVWKILNTLAEKGEVEKVKEVFSVLKDRGLTPINNVVLGPLVKAYIARDDMEGALQEFENCVHNYASTPFKNELFCRFIKAEDADRLQRVMDLSTKQHGEVNSLYDLIFAFLECGKVRQAKKILETPGFRTRHDKLEYSCETYLAENRVEELENLIEVTKDLYNIDRNSLYFYLLKAYCKNNDPDKALSVWTSLQEENIQPSPELLIHLANFLHANNREVPFVVPEVIQESPKSKSVPVPSEVNVKEDSSSNISTARKELRRLLELNELDKCLDLKRRIGVEEKLFPLQETNQLIHKLINAERIEDAKQLVQEMFNNGFTPSRFSMKLLVGKLGKMGDIATLNQFETLLDSQMKRVTMLNSRLCVAYVEAGKGKEYFNDYIKKDVDLVASGEKTKESVLIPVSGALYILKHHPDLLPEFEELAEKASTIGLDSPVNTVWLYCLQTKNFEKARDIWNNQLKDVTNPYLRSLVIESRKTNDEELITETTSQVLSRTNLSESAKGFVISAQLDILNNLGKAEQGLELLKEYLDGQVSLSNIYNTTLNNMKAQLEAKTINFPYEIPQNQEKRRRRRNEDASSGSDSDSD